MLPFRKLLRWVPDGLKGRIDYYFDSNAGNEFGGPLNGQTHRRAIFAELADALPFEAIVETGAFRAVTTKYFAEQTGLPVFSVELAERYFQYSRLSLSDHKNVRLFQGDSREFLSGLADHAACPRQNVFFYLDAHWNADLPLFEEIQMIGDNWDRSVVMIDDFEVPGDDGYSFDDYGNDAKLCLEYIKPLLNDRWSVYFPSIPADAETGLRRGCVVLATNDIADKCGELTSLRRYDPDESR